MLLNRCLPATIVNLDYEWNRGEEYRLTALAPIKWTLTELGPVLGSQKFGIVYETPPITRIPL